MAVLRAIGDPASVPFLVQTLERSDDDGLKIHAIEALANASRGDAVEPLIAALDDRSAMVRITASDALARIGDPAAIPGMEAAKRRARNPFVSFALKMDVGKLRPRQE
jgi:HEAT repeat protein